MYRVEYEQDFCKSFDITVIRKLTYIGKQLIEEKISGFYYGSPDLTGLETFKEKNYIKHEIEVI